MEVEKDESTAIQPFSFLTPPDIGKDMNFRWKDFLRSQFWVRADEEVVCCYYKLSIIAYLVKVMNRIFGSIHYLREKMLSWAQWAELGFDLLLITFLLRLLKYQLAEEESRVGFERKIKAFFDKKHENFETHPIAGF